MVLCLLVGTAIGAWQGFWIAYVRIPPFIVTLAGMLLFRGLAQAILGGTTIFGVLFGLPVDIRHVAFSSAFVGLAVVGTDFAPNVGLLLWAVLGVAAIGFVNLSVSFALALNIALRSRQVSDTPWRMIAGAVLRHLWQHPREFFLPPRRTGSGE